MYANHTDSLHWRRRYTTDEESDAFLPRPSFFLLWGRSSEQVGEVVRELGDGGRGIIRSLGSEVGPQVS